MSNVREIPRRLLEDADPTLGAILRDMIAPGDRVFIVSPEEAAMLEVVAPPVNGMRMTFDEYQFHATRRMVDDERARVVQHMGVALGLVGAAGQIARLVQERETADRLWSAALIDEEIGDCLWYLAAYTHREHRSLSQIAALNLMKTREGRPHIVTSRSY